MAEIKFAAGSFICRQGTLGNSLFVIIEGKCEVRISAIKQGVAEDFKIMDLNPGDYFGKLCDGVNSVSLPLWSSLRIPENCLMGDVAIIPSTCMIAFCAEQI